MAFAFYSPITINAGQVPSPQTNFTVTVKVTDARLKVVGSGGHVQNSTGFDIRPYSDTGLTTPLAYELENYVSGTGELEMHVIISSLVSGMVFYLAYGDASLNTNGSSTGAWDANFKGVWHMGDNAASTVIKESTVTGANGVNVANTSTKTAVGQIGNALTYNGTTDGSSAAINLSASPIVTISFWMNWTTNGDNDHLAFEYTPNYNSNNGILVDWNNSGTTGTFSFGSSSINGAAKWSDRFTRPSAGVWHLVHLVINNTTPVNKAYLDGTLQTLTAVTHTSSPNNNYLNSSLFFMSRNKTSLFAAGVLDEVRISTSERAQDWITTEFNNQNAPGSFETLGTEVPVGGVVTSTGGGVLLDLGKRRKTPRELSHVRVDRASGGEILLPAGTRATADLIERSRRIDDDEHALLLILTEL